uniref:SH2 domain-containing protein n=1 Tax=Parascaris univalens TaxID=6257 RepID=A0A915AEB0_PARUN
MSCSYHGTSSASTSVVADGYPHGKVAAVLAARSHSPGIISEQGPDLRTSPTHLPDGNTSQQDIQVSSKSEPRIIDVPFVGGHSSSNESLMFAEAKHHLPNVALNERKQQPGDIIHHHPVFVKDTSKYWYKPTISREEAINMLRDKPPGTFVVRDSNSFPGAFGLALKVATPPPGIHSGDGTELVRHFLIEPSPKGVKLKGCNNEPIFGTLSALVYQHSITPLALPTKLLLPDYDPASTPEHISAAQALLQQGAACNVTYIASLDTESLTGPEAVRRCIGDALELYNKKMVHPVSVHFKVGHFLCELSGYYQQYEKHHFSFSYLL